MAASWRESVDSLISTTFPAPKSSIPILCATICRSEDLIFKDDGEIEGFITPFVALASHSIGLNVSHCHLHMSSILDASKILLKFCLKELKKTKGFSILSKKQLVSIIEGLCKGHGCLDRTDIVAFSALLKVATIPSTLETVTGDKNEPEDGGFHKGTFFHTLQMAYAACEEELPKDHSKGSESDKCQSLEGREKRDAKSHFSNHNIGVVRELSGGQLLLDLCLALPNLCQISVLHGLNLTDQQKVTLNSISEMTVSEAPKMSLSVIQELSSELALISSIVSLPILEPLTLRRINKIALLALHCIDTALTVATGNFVTGDSIVAGKQTKSFKTAAKTVKMDEELLEKSVESIVDTSLNIYDAICHVIGASSRTGGQTLQNLQLMAVYIIKKSLMAVLELDVAVKSPRVKELASYKIKSLQGSNAYLASIASRGIVLLASLMDELQVEGQGIESSEDVTCGDDITITTNCSAQYRVKRLLKDIPLMQLLLRQFSSLYKKAFSIQSSLSSLTQAKVKTDKTRSPNTSSSDDADSEYISYSEDSSGDEESLFGRWFESTLACPEMVEQPCSKSTKSSKGDNQPEDESSHATNKGAQKFLSLATNTLQFVVKHLLMNSIPEVQQYVRLSFTEKQMSDFAGILSELESDTNKLKDVSGFDHLCVTVDEAIHLMLVEEILPEDHQDSLLDFLGLSPKCDGTWPLRIQSTSLGILARVLLARQQNAFKMNKGNMDIPECTSIWFRLIDTLEKAAVAELEVQDNQDLNVEHLQVLLFVFHNLSLAQRERIMVLCAKALIRVSNFPYLTKTVPVALSRLLIIHDYFLHHFSNPPKELFTQVQRNLFRPHNAIGPANEEDPLAEIMYFIYMNQEEHNYQHACLKYYTANGKTIKACDVITMIPRFYDIRPVEDDQDLDSKACGILFHMENEGSSYNEYYTGVLTLLKAGRECDKMFHSGEVEMTPLDAAFTRHSFGLCWRLLGCLPPSVKYFKSLAGELDQDEKDDSQMLCNLRWLARFCSKMEPKYLETIKGWLLQQGMATYETQYLLDRVAKNSSTLHSSIVAAKNYLEKERVVIQSSVELAKWEWGEGRWSDYNSFLWRIHEKVSESYDVTEMTSISQLPSIFCITLLDVIVAKTHIALSKLFGNTEEDPDLTQIMQVAKDLVPTIIKLVPIYQKFARFYLLSHAANEQKKSCTLSDEKKRLLSDDALAAYSNVIQIGCMRLPKQSSLSMAVVAGLPTMIQNALEKWNSTLMTHFPSTSSWRNSTGDEGSSLSIESFLDSLVSAQMSAMAASNPFEMAPGLKHTLQSLVQLVADLVMWCPKEQGSIHTLYAKELSGNLCPLLVDATTEYLNETATGILERVVGPADGEQFANKIQFYVLLNCQKLLTEQSLVEKERSVIGEEVMLDCLKYIESLMERQSGRSLLENFYTDGRELLKIILLSASCTVSLTYVNKTLKLAVRILQLAEKHPSDSTIRYLARCLSEFQTAEPQRLEEWLKRIVIGIEEDCENTGKMADNRLLLQAFASHLVKEVSSVSEATCCSLLEALVPIGDTLLSMTGSEGACIGAKLSDVIHTASILASADQGKGHSLLSKAAIGWLKTCKSHLENEEIDVKAEGTKESSAMEIAGPLLSYLAEMVLALKHVLEQDTPTSPILTTQGGSDIVVHDLETEWMDDIAADEEESGGEESDEDSLCNKLCTFTITQKDFMNQHWYHCHTCKMNDGVGVCTICAKVCHKDHDISYAKYGSFFCDCGAKEDGSCQSLVKRTPSSSKEVGSSTAAAAAFANGQDLDDCDEEETVRRSKTDSSSQHTSASVSGVGTELAAGSLDEGIQDDASTPSKAIQTLAKQIEKHTDVLVKELQHSSLNTTVLQLLQTLIGPVIETSGPSSQAMGAAQLINKGLEDLHSLDKTVETTEQLMVPTLGSQEGAFENVRMTFSGEQGQAIRQLIGAHVLRRVAMCCLASPKGKRQHLAVSHEKGKITVLQLSALLKQADSSKRKLTLTRLATAQVPFTVLSITGNPCNEDFLAVCGLKDCHVLTFSSSGSVVDHLALHPQLETGNFIIKAVWLPGSQTELAVVTADFVKIYDLSKDALSPLFYFVLPSGKVRDVSFVFHEHERNMVLMSSAGHIYQQPMDDDSSATGGPFYLTNILPVQHSDLEDTNGQVAGGGVSVYYSHTLQIMLFSYTQGKTFMAPWTPGQKEIKKLFPITFKNSNGGNKNAHAALYQWNEVPQHPGLVCCMTHTSGIPVVLMIKPGQVLIQEIKAASSKSKTQDMVAIRHSVNSSDQQRTTMILLCEDGSLRIYMANAEHTGYWMTPSFQPARPLAILRPAKKKKVCKTRTKTTSVSFPIDFFEHCQVLNDVEFGGPDILHVYNAQQAKHRLMTAGMYLASTKPIGFTIEVTNTNPGLVMVGVRVLVGCQSLEKVPSYIEIFGRVIPLSLTRNRWFDLPFTREESLTADKKFTIFFGQSSDPSGVSMVDSMKVYTKTKEVFGWPDDPQEEFAASGGSGVTAPTSVVQEKEMITCISPASPFDKLVVHLLEVLDGSFSAFSMTDESTRQLALDLATSLMTCSVPSCVQNQAKTLLATLHPSKLSYHNHKDQAQLSQITQYLKDYIIAQQEGKPVNLDVETFQRLVVSGRSVAMSRPANLYKFASLSGTETDGSNHFASILVDVFWKIYDSCAQVLSIAPLSSIGLQDLESTVTALVDIIHAFTISDSTHARMAVNLYVKMLLCENQVISFSCKQALIRLLHPLQKRRDRDGPTPPRSGTPSGVRISPEDDDGDDDEGEGERSDSGQEEQSSTEREAQPATQPQPGPPQSAALGGTSSSSRSSQLESLLLGAAGNLPAVLDLPQDADDEAMMELAIALSLQEQSVGSSRLQLQGLSQGQSSLSLEGGNSSDNTTSAAGSEDEYEAPPSSAQGSSAGHSAPRSPIPPGIAQQGLGSESGGSADSIAVEPGSSVATTSIDGDRTVSEHGPRSVSSHCSDEQRGCGHSEEEESSHDHDVRHSLQLLLLEQLLSHLPHLKDVGGVRAIPFMQVLLMLCTDLEDNDKDIAALDIVLDKCLIELNLEEKNYQEMSERTKRHEVQLIVMRFLSVLMSKTKSSSKLATETSSVVCSKTANTLCTVGIVQHCLELLKCLLSHWQKMAKKDEEEATNIGGALLKPQAVSPPPDMSPFFLRQYVKGHAGDVFESYPQLLTEMVLRLPYQVKKVTDSSDGFKSPEFDEEWMYYLSEYMMVQQTPFVRRQVRKLLLFLCGSKDSYRKQRDIHALDFHCKAVRTLSSEGGFDPDCARNPPIVLPYDSLITMTEHLKACSEIASSRISNWQAYCIQDKSALSFLLRASFLFEEGVAPLILQLLSYAICGSKSQCQASSPHKGRKEKDKDRDKDKDKEKDKEKEKEKEKEKATEVSGKNEAAASKLVQQLHEFVDMEILRQFVRNFLLESNSTAVRWQAHELLNKIHKYSTPNQQDKLSDMMWKIWPELPGYGRRAAQFVDLLGYFTIKSSSKTNKFDKYSEKAVQLLKTQNGILENHSNSNVYRMLSGFVEFDGYYLESDPCLVCNNPEVPFQSLKLSAIKADFRFTTTSQLVKLIGSHTISRITLRIADMKRQKMVRAITFYYNNRTVQSVVELKNKRPLWHKAKKCHLTPGQTELKVDFPLPIVACNLMIEYSDFYENFQASSETLQCPRCSASVPANPGVCSNCGENVYQCHKCRSINYDERDPFLCNACGFCKYAKFDYTLTARPCCAVDPIENEEDRKKAVTSINSSLERADRVYRQLSAHRTPLDLLLTRILEHGDAEVSKSTATSQASSTYSSAAQSNTNSTVNKAIQSLAHRYCVECKASFDELSKIIQKVLASRKELLEYDCRVREQPLARSISQSDEDVIEHSLSGPSLPRSLSLLPSTTVVPGKCYGCASAATEHCVTLLRALAMSPGTRQRLVEQGLIRELVDFNLHQGTAQMRADVRHLLCLLTKNNENATEELNHILVQRVTSALEGHRSNPVMVSGIGPEMLLLSNTIEMEDSCWEQRLRCVMRIFMMSVETPSPLVIEGITLSCLKILLRLVKPPAPASKKNKNKDWDTLGTIQSTSDVRINAKKWLEKEHGFEKWKQQAQKKPKGPKKVGKETKEEARQRYLMEKYANRWRMRMEKHEEPSVPKETTDEDWLRQVLFTPSSRSARQIACTIVESLCQVPSRRKQMLDLLTSFLDEVGSAGENASEFFQLYQKLIQPSYLKYCLALQGALMQIGRLITQEINRLSYLEQTTLSSDLSQGYALKMLTELLASFIEHDTLKQKFKGKLVGTVLNGYLSLRRLIVQRTKLIDETQELLLELLEEMTTGTEVETRAFMAICVETLNRYGQDDLRTPVFIFERLCNLIYPEENDVGEFFMTLEKDQQQEDFLQGRMQGNPYSSNEPGLGPLMRDVKNKICTDCELVALLEDDSGMELLINNKIISLDLPVKDVYKKVWCPEGEGEPMKIVYRMRGLLGDATEEFVENLDNSKEEDVNEEEVYRMASVLSVCGGLEAMLTRLSAIRNLARGRQLAAVILKLLGYAVKLKVNRQYLCNPSLNALNVLLGTLNQALQMEQESSGGGGAAMAEEVLGIMESILQEATSSPQPSQPPSEGDRTQLDMLLDKITSPFVRASTKVLQAMMRIIPFLTFGDEKNMKTLIIHFMPYLDFEKFDVERSSDETLFIDCFCKIANGIENNSSGARLKEMILENGIVNKAIKYLETHTPPKPFSKANLAELDVWKEFLARPSLPYVLRLLCGLCKGYEKIQLIIGESTIPVIHRLEQVSSEEKVGSLAENLQEALRENLEVEKKINEVRRQTRAEKKKLAMAMREKQLGALGMQTTAGDKIIAKPTSLTREMEDLSEESGLACCICREGYKYHPQKVLGIYTFSKRCVLEEFETKQRKTQGYCTVSHFNIVHYDCHMAAVRLARGRDEWESAALQNANTKCNGLMPIWGPQVSESAFASCLARHNSYIQESTGHIEPNYYLAIHDLRLLLQRFAFECSFSDDTGGGGRQSNMHFVPYIVHMILYVLNTTRQRTREEKTLKSFVETAHEKWVESSFEVDSPYYVSLLSLFVYSLDQWVESRLTFLKRLIVAAHARHLTPNGSTRIQDSTVQAYSVYKPALIYFFFIDQLHHLFKKSLNSTSPSTWPQAMAENIRKNDEAVLKACDKVLKTYQNDLLPAESFAEFCDVAELLTVIENPDGFLQETFSGYSK